MAKKRIVVDTNILISAFIFPGSIVSELFERIITGDFAMGISGDIISEFKKVLTGKFKLPEKIAAEYIDLITENSEPVKPARNINIIRDKPDNRILEGAAEFGAECIISGDNHLLRLKKYGKIKILGPAEFSKLNF